MKFYIRLLLDFFSSKPHLARRLYTFLLPILLCDCLFLSRPRPKTKLILPRNRILIQRLGNHDDYTLLMTCIRIYTRNPIRLIMVYGGCHTLHYALDTPFTNFKNGSFYQNYSLLLLQESWTQSTNQTIEQTHQLPPHESSQHHHLHRNHISSANLESLLSGSLAICSRADRIWQQKLRKRPGVGRPGVRSAFLGGGWGGKEGGGNWKATYVWMNG